MKIEDILARYGGTTDPEEFMAAVELMLCSEDLEDGDRTVFLCGFMSAMSYAVSRTGDPGLTEKLMGHMIEWKARGWIE